MATDEPDAAAAAAAKAPKAEGDDVAAGAPVGSGRRAAQGVQYKDGETARARKGDIIVAEEEPEADSEADAIRETQGERPNSQRRCGARPGAGPGLGGWKSARLLAHAPAA